VEVHSRNLDVSKHNVKKLLAGGVEASKQTIQKRLNHVLEVSCFNVGMDIYENRRRWLAYWIEHDFKGDRKAAEMATGYTRSQLSQFLSKSYQGGESPQEKAARRLEKKFGKAERIMETPAPGAGQAPLVPTLQYIPPTETDSELPSYVLDAIMAVRKAYIDKVPREVFDAVRVLFSQLHNPESGKLTPPKKDEAVGSSDAMQSISGQAKRVMEDAESHLATRSGDKRAARADGGKRSKNIRH
jgi:hypothetical protein